MANADNDPALEAISQPVLLLQENPRQVVGANLHALGLFGKAQVAGRRGGEVFDCLHSFSEAGCGNDVHCESCAIKGAIVDTFTTGQPHRGVCATLQIKRAEGIRPFTLEVTAEKTGDMALLRIERYTPDEPHITDPT